MENSTEDKLDNQILMIFRIHKNIAGQLFEFYPVKKEVRILFRMIRQPTAAEVILICIQVKERYALMYVQNQSEVLIKTAAENLNESESREELYMYPIQNILNKSPQPQLQVLKELF